VLSVKELVRIAKSMTMEEFSRQLGPFALVARPPDAVTAQRSLQLGAKRTVTVKRNDSMDEMSLLFEFDDLMVATLPPVGPGETLSVGRAPDCDLVVDDPSVSKHHAALVWDEPQTRVLVEDLASSNGVHLNGERLKSKMSLQDGDTLAFGDARFCLLLTKTLYARLTTGRFRGG
jgi:hypothetical protein